MKEIKDIIAAFEEAELQGLKTALATVVHVSGSSYRRPGARMLVTEEGKLTGAISGGCLEGDALRKALMVINNGRKKLVVYDTTDEDDAKLGIQLGCNGIVSILFEPIFADEKNNPVALLKKSLSKRTAYLLVTGFDKANHHHTGTMSRDTFPPGIAPQLNAIANEVMKLEQSRYQEVPIEGANQAFLFEYCQPPLSLVIIGAGNDVMPLATMVNMLGWELTVVDGRPTHVTANRFPKAETLLLVKSGELAEKIKWDDRTAFVLMTHNYNYDLAMLGVLVKRPPPYIGLLGPSSKRERMLRELGENGLTITEEVKSSIYGPTGLDLGAETATEIAFSIVAEIMAVMHNKKALPLRDKQQPIHGTAL